MTEQSPLASPTNNLARVVDSIDLQLLQMWLHGKSAQTQDYYRIYALNFLTFVGKPLASCTLADCQAFATSLASQYEVSSQAVILAAIKSLLTFGHETGALQFNVGAMMKLPKGRDCLSDRILDLADVLLMIRLEPEPRNQAILQLLYVSGIRVSELCSLLWRDLVARGTAGQVTVFGKGGKTRTVLLSDGVWAKLQQLRQGAPADAPLFPSPRTGRSLQKAQINRIVRAAAQRAGIDEAVSPHWLRHSHATHAIENGAPIHLVQQTLGHSSVATTSRYLHARPNESSGRFLAL